MSTHGAESSSHSHTKKGGESMFSPLSPDKLVEGIAEVASGSGAGVAGDAIVGTIADFFTGGKGGGGSKGGGHGKH